MDPDPVWPDPCPDQKWEIYLFQIPRAHCKDIKVNKFLRLVVIQKNIDFFCRKNTFEGIPPDLEFSEKPMKEKKFRIFKTANTADARIHIKGSQQLISCHRNFKMMQDCL